MKIVAKKAANPPPVSMPLNPVSGYGMANALTVPQPARPRTESQ